MQQYRGASVSETGNVIISFSGVDLIENGTTWDSLPSVGFFLKNEEQSSISAA
jgi:hypothetical protein